MSKLVPELAFGTPKFYIAPYDKTKHELIKLSSNCDVKSGLRGLDKPQMASGQFRLQHNCNCLKCGNPPEKWSTLSQT